MQSQGNAATASRLNIYLECLRLNFEADVVQYFTEDVAQQPNPEEADYGPILQRAKERSPETMAFEESMAYSVNRRFRS